MKVTHVQAKDVHATIELSLKELKMVKRVLDMSEFKYNKDIPEDLKILEFYEEMLYPFVEGVIQGIEEQGV